MKLVWIFVHLALISLVECLQLSPFRLQARRSRMNALHASTSSQPAPQPTWFPSQIITNKKDGEGLRLLTVSVPETVAAAFTSPGQYVQIKIGDNKPGFYAIASAPSGNPELTFLIKETETNAPLTTCTSGATISLSLPQGKGYRISEFFDNYQADWAVFNVLLLACGSGLAPLASVLDSGILKLGATPSFFPASPTTTTPETPILPGASRRATLYIGARSEAHLPLKDKYSVWEKSGVKVVPVLSQPGPQWSGRKGYIQDALGEQRHTYIYIL